ncbi:unnamed protein product [Caenorhabditis sp. 36 PRJEB53466]|nr:unnamed protein product [Caenorhabditis sp. 36 PRJEB53466]
MFGMLTCAVTQQAVIWIDYKIYYFIGGVQFIVVILFGWFIFDGCTRWKCEYHLLVTPFVLCVVVVGTIILEKSWAKWIVSNVIITTFLFDIYNLLAGRTEVHEAEKEETPQIQVRVVCSDPLSSAESLPPPSYSEVTEVFKLKNDVAKLTNTVNSQLQTIRMMSREIGRLKNEGVLS